MARVALPPSRVRARRRRMYRRVSFVAGLALVLLLAALAAAARIPTTLVDTIEVSGVETLSTSSVEAFVRAQMEGEYWWVLPERNIFLYPKAGITAALYAQYPVLSSAEVHAVDFHTVEVKLFEREPRALWCASEDECYFMDAGGTIYARAPQFSSPVYVSYYGGAPGALPRQYLTQAQFSGLAALVDAIVQKLPQEPLKDAAVDSNGDVHMEFESGFAILFALSQQGGDVFDRLGLALGSAPFAGRPLGDFEYLDLRFGDKLYYKLKAQ